MTKQTKSNWKKQILFVSIAIIIFTFAASSQAFGQKYKPGDHVECDNSNIGSWQKGTVVDYLEKDEPVSQGEYYLVRVVIDKMKDMYPEGVLCRIIRMRPLKETVANPPQKQTPTETNGNMETKTDEKVETKNGLTAKFKPGDRIECDGSGIGNWQKGTVLPFKENDNPELDKDKTGKYFYIHRVLEDRDAGDRQQGGFCYTDRMRPLAGGAQMEIPKTAVPIGKVTVDENNTLSADRPILECPVAQTSVKNGARPNQELFNKIIQCRKGEKATTKGMDGAVTVEVTALQFGAARPWIYSRDIGGKPGITIYPVKATYTVKTFYCSRTDVSQNWIRILNFYVNEFGEWTIGSEEHVKAGERVDVPRLPENQ